MGLPLPPRRRDIAILCALPRLVKRFRVPVRRDLSVHARKGTAAPPAPHPARVKIARCFRRCRALAIIPA